MKHLAEKKKLLKKYLDKLTSNSVVCVNGKVVRVSDLTRTMCQNNVELDFEDVKILIHPIVYTKYMQIVPSTVTIKIYEEDKVMVNNKISTVGKNPLEFVSQLTNSQIERLISVLEPIISDIDREVALINEEEGTPELRAKKRAIKEIKGYLDSNLDFDKLPTSQLVKFGELLYSAVK